MRIIVSSVANLTCDQCKSEVSLVANPLGSMANICYSCLDQAVGQMWDILELEKKKEPVADYDDGQEAKPF